MHNLPQLSYAFDALEPVIDAATMEIHYSKHHQAYLDKLNAGLASYPDLQALSVEDLLITIETLPADVKTVVRNHGGGHHNHSLFWTSLSPNGGGKPSGELAKAIDQTFQSFDQFVTDFNTAATGQFGSGWGWLVLDADKQLKIVTTANQDSPLMAGQKPLLGIDVWEHAYYLKYQNRRPEYLTNIWQRILWSEIENRYVAARS